MAGHFGRALCYFTLCTAYPPWVRVFQSLMSSVVCLASSIKTNFVKRRYHWLVESSLFCNCGHASVMDETWNGKEQVGLTLLASPTKHGTLSLCLFLLYLSSLRKSSQNLATLRFETVFENVFEVLGSAGSPLVASNEQKFWMTLFQSDVNSTVIEISSRWTNNSHYWPRLNHSQRSVSWTFRNMDLPKDQWLSLFHVSAYSWRTRSLLRCWRTPWLHICWSNCSSRERESLLYAFPL